MYKLVLVIALALTSCGALNYSIIPAKPTATTQATAPATKSSSKPEKLITTPAPDTCTVTTGAPVGYLNLRNGAGVQYAVIRVLTEGEVLTVVTRGAWHEVTDTRGNHGYINSTYCK